MFRGEGGVVYFEAPSRWNFIYAPLVYTPPTPRRAFSGMGVCKSWPREPLDQFQNKKTRGMKKYPPTHQNVRFPGILLPNAPRECLQKIRKSYFFGGIFRYFRGIFPMSWRRGNSDVVIFSYFGLSGFCSVAGWWVVKFGLASHSLGLKKNCHLVPSVARHLPV